MEEFFARLNRWHDRYFRYIKLLLAIGILCLILWVFPYVFSAFLPILIGYALAALISVTSRLFTKKLHMKKKPALWVSAVLIVAVVGSIVAALIRFILDRIQDFISLLKELVASGMVESLEKAVADFAGQMEARFSFLSHETVSKLLESLEGLGDTVTSWIGSGAKLATGGAISVVRSVPQAIIFAVVMVLSTFFFLRDREKIAVLLKEKTPHNIKKVLHTLKEQVLFAFHSYIKAQLILMSIAFVELSVGYFILGRITGNAVLYYFWLLLAIAVAIIDAIPILGVGIVNTPWAIMSLLVGHYKLAIGLWIIQAVCFTVRQVIEPHIVSAKIGLHPIITLIGIYTGLYFFGVFGMIFVPITVLILINLYKAGAFDWIFSANKGEKNT